MNDNAEILKKLMAVKSERDALKTECTKHQYAAAGIHMGRCIQCGHIKHFEPDANLLTLHDCVWQLGNALRDCMNRLDTIRETNPELRLKREIDQAKHTLERYAKGPMFYKPHPLGWEFDTPNPKTA